jgi:hypothetical protein
MNKQLRNYVASAILMLPVAATLVALPSTVMAQAAPEVRALDATADGRIEPGTSITFTLEGTPRSQASVRIRGMRENITLRETQRGVYVGRYTIKRGDRIDADSNVRARLESGGRVASASYDLDELLPPPRASLPPPRVVEPRIERFGMAPLDRIEPGAELRFGLEGTPGGTAVIDLPGINNNLGLREVRPGVYEGTYTLRRADNFDPRRPIVATLRNGDRVTTATMSAGAGRPGGDNRPPNADNRAPTLKFLDPAEGSTVAPGPQAHVAATFEDAGGTGIDPASVQILLSGRNITREAKINRESFSYWGPALPPGRHTVDVTARDSAGNAMRRTWSFDVASGVVPPPVVRPPVVVVPVVPVPTSLAVQVLNHYDNTEIGPDPVLIKARTAPGATVLVNVRAIPAPAPAAGQQRIVYAQTLQADAEGIISFTMIPGTPYPGERYEISMIARRGAVTQESRFTLRQRPG